MTRKVARYNKGAITIQYHLRRSDPYDSKQCEKYGYNKKILVIFIRELAIDSRDSMNIGFIHTLYLALYIKRWKYLN